MSEVVTVEVELHSKDYESFFPIATRRAFARGGASWERVRYGLFVSVGIVVWALMAAFLPSFFPAAPKLGIGLFVLLYVCFWYIWRKRALRTMAPEDGGTLLGVHTFSLTPEGFVDQGPRSYTLTQWSAVQEIKETAAHFFVFVDKTAAYIIPKGCFPHAEAAQAFREELRQRMSASDDNPERSLLFGLGGRLWMRPVLVACSVIFLTSLLSSRTTVKRSVEKPPAPSQGDEARNNAWEEAEELLYAQPDLVAKQTAALLPERPGVVDAYFLGVGGDAEQDVFMKETLYAQQVFNRRFDTRGRSLVLINNAKTKDTVPLASFTNLRATLQSLGRIMNPEEDILFLLFTSHGSKRKKLAVEYWPLPLKSLAATEVAQLLAEAGIKWRVVIISACYSGGFIGPLQDEHALILTSSTATRPSFGCGKDEELTYFGKAFLEDELNHGGGILEAFAGAVTRVHQREAAQQLQDSAPQSSTPPAIVEKLSALQGRLATSLRRD